MAWSGLLGKWLAPTDNRGAVADEQDAFPVGDEAEDDQTALQRRRRKQQLLHRQQCKQQDAVRMQEKEQQLHEKQAEQEAQRQQRQARRQQHRQQGEGVEGRKQSPAPSAEQRLAAATASGAIVGWRVQVWWAAEGEWFPGTVLEYKQRKKMYVLRYDDGETEEVMLPNATVQLFEPAL